MAKIENKPQKTARDLIGREVQIIQTADGMTEIGTLLELDSQLNATVLSKNNELTVVRGSAISKITDRKFEIG